eukprot:Skav207360  [mRNA]  locus=scaffold426:206094:206702:- [translate_table: standard]
MISSEMPIVPFPKKQSVEGREDSEALAPMESLLAPENKETLAPNKPSCDALNFAESFAAEDFGGCSSALLQELKGVEDIDLLPLLVGVLGYIGGVEFSDQADQKQKRRGAFSKSVEDSGSQSIKVPEPEAFRRLRRAAFPSDAKTLLLNELGDQLVSDNELSGDTLARFGFLEGRGGSEDLRKAMSDELTREGRSRDEPCGF